MHLMTKKASRALGGCDISGIVVRISPRDDNGLMSQPPELPDSDVTALAGNIFATLTGSYRFNLVSQTRVRKDLMEKQIGFMGTSSSFWGVIGILVLVAGLILICALVVLAFGLDIGGVLSS